MPSAAMLRPRGTGLGLAVAILLDALVIRCLLVPAVMQLLGSRAWWHDGTAAGAPDGCHGPKPATDVLPLGASVLTGSRYRFDRPGSAQEGRG